MNAITKSNVFKTGNGAAVRLPKALGLKPGDPVDIVRRGKEIIIRPSVNLEQERADLAELARILRELGPRKNPVLRDPIEFPDRPGLY
jgi:antitoxin VapB